MDVRISLPLDAELARLTKGAGDAMRMTNAGSGKDGSQVSRELHNLRDGTGCACKPIVSQAHEMKTREPGDSETATATMAQQCSSRVAF